MDYFRQKTLPRRARFLLILIGEKSYELNKRLKGQTLELLEEFENNNSSNQVADCVIKYKTTFKSCYKTHLKFTVVGKLEGTFFSK